MPNGSLHLFDTAGSAGVFIVMLATASAAESPSGDAPPTYHAGSASVARLQTDSIAFPPSTTFTNNRDFIFPNLTNLGAAFMRSERLFGEAEMSAGGGSGARFNLSIGLNF